jgi:hypothetical protein
MKYLVVVLLLSLAMVAPVFADTFEVSGQTNVPACISIETNCTLVEFTAVLTATPGHNAYGDVFFVTSLTGTFDNRFAMSGGGGFLAGGRLVPIPNPDGGSRALNFTEDGNLWSIGFDQAFGTGSVFMLGYGGGNPGVGSQGGSFVTWDIKPVATPEPPTCLLLGMGLVAVMFLNWRKPILARVRCS